MSNKEVIQAMKLSEAYSILDKFNEELDYYTPFI